MSIDEAHEAIVSEELFHAAHAFRNKVQDDSTKRSNTAYSTNIFKGKIFCTHCGGYLERKKNYDKYIYHCVANRMTHNSYHSNRIGKNDARLTVLEQLIQHKDRISCDNNLPPVSTEIISELRFTGMELSYLKNVLRSLYENFVDGVLNEAKYVELKGSYHEKIDVFTQRAAELKQKMNDEKLRRVSLKKTLSMLDGLANTEVLKQTHIEALVDR